MRNSITLLIAATVSLAASASGHFPPTFNTNCDPYAEVHDFVGNAAFTAITGMSGETGAGVAIVYDGAISCGLAGDGDYEFGVGAFLPSSHHDPRDGYTVTAAFTDGGFIFGADGANHWSGADGIIWEDDWRDCFENQSSAGSYFTDCGPGAVDEGWWFFPKCNVTTASNSHLWGTGSITGDDDANGYPNGLQDNEGDGIPNSLQRDVNANGIPDNLEDTNGNGVPDSLEGNTLNLNPGSIPPDMSASCLISGHISSTLGGSGAPRPMGPVLVKSFGA